MPVLIPSTPTVTSVGYVHYSATALMIRPADTTAYTIGDLVGNSTTGASVVPLSFPATRVDGGAVAVDRVKIYKSGTSVTNASFRVHLFSSLLTVTSGDNAALVMGGAGSYLGCMDVVVNQVFSDGSAGFSDTTPKVIRTKIPYGYNVYGILEARGAYTPVSAELFTVTLDIIQG